MISSHGGSIFLILYLLLPPFMLSMINDATVAITGKRNSFIANEVGSGIKNPDWGLAINHFLNDARPRRGNITFPHGSDNSS